MGEMVSICSSIVYCSKAKKEHIFISHNQFKIFNYSYSESETYYVSKLQFKFRLVSNWNIVSIFAPTVQGWTSVVVSRTFHKGSPLQSCSSHAPVIPNIINHIFPTKGERHPPARSAYDHKLKLLKNHIYDLPNWNIFVVPHAIKKNQRRLFEKLANHIQRLPSCNHIVTKWLSSIADVLNKLIIDTRTKFSIYARTRFVYKRLISDARPFLPALLKLTM